MAAVTVVDKSECVKVAVRVRPLSNKEKEENQVSIVEVDSNCKPNQIYVSLNTKNIKTYAFDHVFDCNIPQNELYEQCASAVVDSVLHGYNGTLFAYGQTGTGKTFTMEGNINDDELCGIIPRTFNQIMDYVTNSQENIEFLVRISFLEIYQDEVYDLLSKEKRKKMQVKEGNNGFYVKNLTMFSVKSVNDMLKVLKKGQRTRAVGATAMNPGSSRSHCILTIIVESSHKTDDGKDHYIMGKLNLVDLAGSERQKKTKAVGNRLEEAKSINLSLSALGNVIKALVNKKATHVPFRDSKLTKLLSDSLGGNTKTLMLANIGPAAINKDETMSTLRYANRAKNIQNKPRINEDPKDAMIRKMKEELNNLQRQLNGDTSNLQKHEKKIIKKVEVWKGVSKKEVEELKLKAIDAKNKLKQLHNLDKEKYQNAKIEAERAAKFAAENLKIAEIKLKEEHNELEQLEDALKTKTTQLMHGGKKLMSAKQQEEELNETKKQLRASEKAQKQFLNELDEMMQNEQYLDEQFNTIQEEIADTTNKLKTLWKQYQTKNKELNDLEEENNAEENELSDNIKTLTRQYQLKSLILDYFIPEKWLTFIEQHSKWDQLIDQWRIPALEYSGNNMLPQNNNDDDYSSDGDDNDGDYDGKSDNECNERPLTMKRMQDVWKRVKSLIGDDEEYNHLNEMIDNDLNDLHSDESSNIATEIQEAIHIALNTNIDPNQNGDKVYLTYGVDIDTLKKRGKSKKNK